MLKRTDLIKVKYSVMSKVPNMGGNKENLIPTTLEPLSTDGITKVIKNGNKFYIDKSGSEVIPKELVTLTSNGFIKLYKKENSDLQSKKIETPNVAKLIKSGAYVDNVDSKKTVKVPVQPKIIPNIEQEQNVAHVVKNGQYSIGVKDIEESFNPHAEIIQKYVTGIDEVLNVKGLIDFKIEEYYTMFDYGDTVFVVSDSDKDRYKQKIAEITKMMEENSISYEEITSRRR